MGFAILQNTVLSNSTNQNSLDIYEHRIGARVQVKLDIALSLIGFYCGKFTVSNAGCGWMFLDQCTDLFEVGDFAVVSIDEDTPDDSAITSIKAIVESEKD